MIIQIIQNCKIKENKKTNFRNKMMIMKYTLINQRPDHHPNYHLRNKR